MRGYFGIGVYHPKSEVNIGTLMRSAVCFGANFTFTIGRRYTRQASDTTHTIHQIPVYHYRDFEELYQNLPIGCRVIGVEIHKNAKQLNKFVHPDRCCYVLGAEDGGIPPKIIDQVHDLIEIPSKYCLNVSATGSIVMYDRISKGNLNG